MAKLSLGLNVLLTSLLITSSATVLAALGPEKMFGGDKNPVSLDRLPVSKLRTSLENLPAPARERALKWLSRIEFPEGDVEFLRVDSHGGVFYRDDLLIPDEISQVDLEADPIQAGINPVDAFVLHSKPGATNVVYVNFTGHTIENTAWNQSVSRYQARPFDLDGDTSSFSTSERLAIGEMWHRIAEDFASFDIDVTTESPSTFGPNVGHLLITSRTDVNGVDMPHSSAGGVAYVGVWGASYYTTYQPALVYYDNLASVPYYTAEAASHELGHNLGLSHDGTSTASYYTGHGNGLTSWGAIMGVGYYTNVTQWSKGEYVDANNPQDDIAIIANLLQYRTDDHSNTAGSAAALLVDALGYIASSHPEFDPLNQRPDNKGVIETRSDVDVFYFDTGAGQINLDITPAWAAYTRSDKRGANLDIQARLYDVAGNGITVELGNDTNAVISTNLAAGRYYLEVSGVGNATTPYSDYGSLGQYYISGQVVPLATDTTPPNPNPMTWTIAPNALSRTAIEMTATTAIDDSGTVEYQFVCVGGGQQCVSSAWQAEPYYVSTGLDADTSYSYQTRARDNAGNETEWSATVSVQTLANSTPQSVDDSVQVNQNMATTVDVLANDSDADGDILDITQTSVPSHGDVVISNSSQLIYTPDSDYLGGDSFTYTITDGINSYSTSTVTIEVIAANLMPIAVNDSAEVLLNGSITIDVLANDSDPEGNMLVVESVTNGAKGTTIVNNDGSITYSVSGKNRGGDSFSYTISDGEQTATALVSISIVRKLSGGDDSGGGGGKCHPKRGC